MKIFFGTQAWVVTHCLGTQCPSVLQSHGKGLNTRFVTKPLELYSYGFNLPACRD